MRPFPHTLPFLLVSLCTRSRMRCFSLSISASLFCNCLLNSSSCLLGCSQWPACSEELMLLPPVPGLWSLPPDGCWLFWNEEYRIQWDGKSLAAFNLETIIYRFHSMYLLFFDIYNASVIFSNVVARCNLSLKLLSQRDFKLQKQSIKLQNRSRNLEKGILQR